MSESQNPPTLRSQQSQIRSCVRFVNSTRRKIEVFWIDFSGRPVLYCSLQQNEFIDINTYVTHPWIFLDYITKERYLVNNEVVYMPKRATYVQTVDTPIIIRDIEHVIQPLLPLRELCIRKIKELLTYDRHAFLLELPLMLQKEIANAPPRKV